jgi:hypothetical protein
MPGLKKHEEVHGIAEHRADDESKAVACPRLRQGETSMVTRSVNELCVASLHGCHPGATAPEIVVTAKPRLSSGK